MSGGAPRRPILCLVTDRHRACPGADPSSAIACLSVQARYAAEAGVDLIQVRERDLETAQLAALTAALVDAVRGSRTRIVVNERIDVALAADAAGVHLRGDSLPASRARALLPRPRLIGKSLHDANEAVGQTEADYVIVGTVYQTASKPGRTEWLGAAGLRVIVDASTVPVLAIGGVTLQRAAEVALTGAAGIAAISLFLGTPEKPIVPLADVVTELHRRFSGER